MIALTKRCFSCLDKRGLRSARAAFHGAATSCLGPQGSAHIDVWLSMAYAVSDSRGHGRKVCRGSHRLRAFERLRAYASSRVGADGTRSGWLSDDGAGVAELCINTMPLLSSTGQWLDLLRSSNA